MDTTFVNGTTLTDADWFNDVNRLHYTILGDPADIAAVKNTLHSAPGAIGNATPSTGAFTTITSTGGIQTTGAVLSGYGTGAGGTVTQATSKSTAVTLNKPCGTITMHNANLAANTVVVFNVNNSLVAATDNVVVTLNYDSNYIAWVDLMSAGLFRVAVWNRSGGDLAQAVVMNFAVIKSVTS